MRCPIIAEMRFRAPWAVVTALLALTLPAVAVAEPKPIKKPDRTSRRSSRRRRRPARRRRVRRRARRQSAGVQQLVVEFEFVHGEHAAGEHLVVQHDVAGHRHARLRPGPARRDDHPVTPTVVVVAVRGRSRSVGHLAAGASAASADSARDGQRRPARDLARNQHARVEDRPARVARGDRGLPGGAPRARPAGRPYGRPLARLVGRAASDVAPVRRISVEALRDSPARGGRNVAASLSQEA